MPEGKDLKLTIKQKRFAEEYVIDLNATAAYRRAGYKASSIATATVNASRLLANDKVKQYIAELQTDRAQRTQITADRVLQELARIAFANVTDVCSFDKTNGLSYRNSSELTDDVKAAISEIGSETVTRSIGRGEQETSVKLKVKMHSKIEALKQLTQYLGLTSDFNASVMGLKKYGLQLQQSETAESGWEVVKVDSSTSAD